ncbi:MAG: isoleucine--tRNA ligase [Candidatus Woesearchaeota archaeon]
MDLKQEEEDLLKKWKEIKLLEMLERQNSQGKPYFFHDGPPYANNVPHAGHFRNNTYKDVYVRYAFMKGYNVLFQPGFDTHGLPIENMVEKQLKLTSKKDIETMGISKFTALCKQHATLNKELWMDMFDRMGAWYAWKKPYLTYENEYMDSCWHAFKKFWDKGLVYEGERPVHWCPHCQTSLAGYEATDAYKNMSDPGVFVLFKLKDDSASVLVFTTTPWTLPSNVALIVHPDEEYARTTVSHEGKIHEIILAKKRITMLEDWGMDVTVKETFPGKQLDGKKYEPLIDCQVQRDLEKEENALRIFMSIALLKERVPAKVALKKGIPAGDLYEHFVTAEEGTGIVHCAPGHGKTDFEVGEHYKMPRPSPLDDEAKFTKEVEQWQGKYVKEADHSIAEYLHEHGKLLKHERIDHSYPLCWRCKNPLIFRLSNQWFIRIDKIRDRMLEFNEQTDWVPEFAKERLQSWILNASDWNFSRQRYWGTPIPIWKAEDGDTIVIGSLSELEKLSGMNLKDFDLHAASDIKITKDGKEFKRVPAIFDVWFDAGCSPFASLNYPIKNKATFEEHFPVDRIIESQDQIRGWFYYLMVCGTGYFDKPPYKAVSMYGWVVDANGEKMSKSLGNFIGAKELLEEFGADLSRFYVCWDIAPESLQKFSKETIKTEVSKFFIILRNLVKLAEGAKPIESTKETEDRWLLSRLHSTIKKTNDGIDTFQIHEATRAIYDFVITDLSRTYVQMVRERMDDDTIPRHMISHCLQTVSRLLAPFAPFTAEEIYSGEKKSVHLESYPELQEGMINQALEDRMIIAQEVITATLSARDIAKLGVRWPLPLITIQTEDGAMKNALEATKELVLSQTNAKQLQFNKIKHVFEIKPNYKTLGKSFGTETGEVATLIKAESAQISKALSEGNKEIKIGKYRITSEHLETTLKPSQEDEIIVNLAKGMLAINTTLSSENLIDGYTRELMRRIQQERKNLGLERGMKVPIEVMTEDEELAPGILRNLEKYVAKLGASRIEVKVQDPGEDAFLIRGRRFKVSVDQKV